MAELYSLPDGWEWKTIEELCEILDRLRKPISQKDRISGEYPYYGATGIVDYINNYIFDEKLLLIGEDGAKWGANENTAFIAEGKYWVNNHAHIMRPNKELVIDSLLIYYLNTTDLMEYITGATVKKLNQEKLKSINIPLPPLEEQKRIVAKLDILFEKIDKAIALHQKNIDEADIFMESVLNDVFVELNGVYQKRQLDSFDKKMSSGGTPSRKEKLYWDNGTIDWFSSGELNQLYTLPSKEKITQLGLEKTSTKLFSKGTLLIGMYDTAAMKMSILSNDGSCNQAIVGFKSDESELNILFLKYQLEYLKKDILEQRQGVRQQNLNLSKIKNIEIEYPPLKTQQKVVAYLDEISNKMEKIKQIQKEKMQSLKALKASILDKAFKGEL
ncbi:restriction endonuclease subunit S [Aliarcobacter cryaerophilus]|uniref:restriction endonuclease subunit S n=1 Tax=Aliarcobacter cryaerophilus TaxID=28198 RepID=UPI0021B6772D|nr:restriction endonuclease subunit S [Aliarcobacter cryaerophilus]MCT7470924.1 restriction endonuclease subunit S [Aliarcobacter cryaerophilus]